MPPFPHAALTPDIPDIPDPALCLTYDCANRQAATARRLTDAPMWRLTRLAHRVAPETPSPTPTRPQSSDTGPHATTLPLTEQADNLAGAALTAAHPKPKPLKLNCLNLSPAWPWPTSPTKAPASTLAHPDPPQLGQVSLAAARSAATLEPLPSPPVGQPSDSPAPPLTAHSPS